MAVHLGCGGPKEDVIKDEVAPFQAAEVSAEL